MDAFRKQEKLAMVEHEIKKKEKEDAERRRKDLADKKKKKEEEELKQAHAEITELTDAEAEQLEHDIEEQKHKIDGIFLYIQFINFLHCNFVNMLFVYLR